MSGCLAALERLRFGTDGQGSRCANCAGKRNGIIRGTVDTPLRYVYTVGMETNTTKNTAASKIRKGDKVVFGWARDGVAEIVTRVSVDDIVTIYTDNTTEHFPLNATVWRVR